MQNQCNRLLIGNTADDFESFLMTLQQAGSGLQYLIANDGMAALAAIHRRYFLPPFAHFYR